MYFGSRNLTEVMLVLGGFSQEEHSFGGGCSQTSGAKLPTLGSGGVCQVSPL